MDIQVNENSDFLNRAPKRKLGKNPRCFSTRPSFGTDGWLKSALEALMCAFSAVLAWKIGMPITTSPFEKPSLETVKRRDL